MTRELHKKDLDTIFHMRYTYIIFKVIEIGVSRYMKYVP